jgi:hypothetical protein
MGSLCASFSTPSKHRKAPPIISSGVISQGAKALMSSAAGTRMALFTSEPLATAQTTGSSRSARTPATCWALSARSSPSTPAVFLAATLVSTATSSRMVAMSSSSASRLVLVRPCSLPKEVAAATVDSLCRFLAHDGERKLVQFTYQPRAPFAVPRHLRWQRRTVVWRNTPPAGVWELQAVR